MSKSVKHKCALLRYPQYAQGTETPFLHTTAKAEFLVCFDVQYVIALQFLQLLHSICQPQFVSFRHLCKHCTYCLKRHTVCMNSIITLLMRKTLYCLIFLLTVWSQDSKESVGCILSWLLFQSFSELNVCKLIQGGEHCEKSHLPYLVASKGNNAANNLNS